MAGVFTGHPLINPSVPVRTPLPSLQDGFMITIQAATPPQAKRFNINLATENALGECDIPFHFNPRFDEHPNSVVRNSFRGRRWEAEERSGGFPLTAGQPFECIILTTNDHYKVAINGSHFCEFRHRAPKEQVRFLVIQGTVTITCVSFQGQGMPAEGQRPQAGHAVPAGGVPLPGLSAPLPAPAGYAPPQAQGPPQPQPFGPPQPQPFGGPPQSQPFGGPPQSQYPPVAGYAQGPAPNPYAPVPSGMPAGAYGAPQHPYYPPQQTNAWSAPGYSAAGAAAYGCSAPVPPTLGHPGMGAPPAGAMTTPAGAVAPQQQPRSDLPVPYKTLILPMMPNRMVIISAVINTGNPDRFAINLRCGDSPNSDIALHFNPRMRDQVVVRNTQQSGRWGVEERQVPHMPFTPGTALDIIVLCESDKYKVAVNNQHYIEYKHRITNLYSVNFLEITGNIRLNDVRIH